jgi:hypothetical protein
MVQITDISEEFAPIYFSSENETSVMIIILTFFTTAQHPRGTNKFLHPITAHEVLGVCVLAVSVFCGAAFSVRASS